MGGNAATNFTIDSITGKLEPLGIIDFEGVVQAFQENDDFTTG